MDGYELKIKLDDFKPEISRTILIPKKLLFNELCNILEIIFSFSTLHLSIFSFPGLKIQMWDLNKAHPGEACVDMNNVPISDYFDLFKKCYWTYDLSNNWSFTIKIKKTKKVENYPVVKSFMGEFNPLEDFGQYYLEELLYNKNYDDLTRFNLDEVNNKLKKYYSG